MDELATQPSTQPYLDPRRNGDNSLLSEDDESDVICILHPGSPAAYEVVDRLSKVSPQHILQNRNLLSTDDEVGESILENDDGLGFLTDQNVNNKLDNKTRHQGSSRNNGQPMDIALRLSSRLKNPCLGFTFGRMAKKCDIVLSTDDGHEMNVSGMHFRISINKSGVLMLDDTSTNGTHVDTKVLRGGHRVPGAEPRRMIAGGSIIELMLATENRKATGVLKFIVSVPTRNRAGEKWAENLETYLAWLRQAERQADVLAEAACKGNAATVPPVSVCYATINDLLG